MREISLIVPSKNEKESLSTVLEELKKYKNIVGEVIIVVDDIKDNSIPIAKNFDCKIIIQKSKGFGAAIIEGFKNAKYEFGCIFNADYSMDPKYLNDLTKISENADFVFGSRYTADNESGSNDDDFITFIGNRFFSFMTNRVLGIRLNDILYTYVLCNVKKFNQLKLKKHDFTLCIELPVKIKKNKFSYSELSMKERKRFGGKKKVKVFKDGFLILIEILKSIRYLLK
jgi:Glycosyltransferases, probably involved in cell wall biogenesis